MKGLTGMGPGPNCKRHVAMLLREMADARPPIGSNEWAAGADRTLRRRALLANDPHLALQMPGVWYLVDLRAPGYHVAGAALPGCPTVVLGHDESVAWGATDGTVTSLSVFQPPARLDPSAWQTERFAVRFHGDASKQYYRTPRAFGLTTTHGKFVLVVERVRRSRVAVDDLHQASIVRERSKRLQPHSRRSPVQRKTSSSPTRAAASPIIWPAKFRTIRFADGGFIRQTI